MLRPIHQLVMGIHMFDDTIPDAIGNELMVVEEDDLLLARG